MVTIRNMEEIRNLPDSVAKRAMEARATLCHDGDEELLRDMEEEFSGVLGGDWYLFEEGDDPRSVSFDDGYPVNLLGEEWNWCDSAVLENGCYVVFWGTNDAGGPCLFVTDSPWIPTDLRAWLDDLIMREYG